MTVVPSSMKQSKFWFGFLPLHFQHLHFGWWLSLSSFESMKNPRNSCNRAETDARPNLYRGQLRKRGHQNENPNCKDSSGSSLSFL